MALSAPQPLAEQHQLGEFNSGVPSLDEWLKRRARANQAADASRTYVVTEQNSARVVAYSALASGSVSVAAAGGRFKRNMPDPVPVAVLGRLAVDDAYQGRGLGRSLFRDSALRVVNAADVIGIRGMLVHAISEEAKAFYLKLGLDVSPFDPMTLMVTLADIRRNLSAA